MTSQCPEMWRSAGLLVFREVNRDLFWLLIDSRLSKATSAWEFPKGLIEIGEEPLQAALRECFEETGVRVLPEQVDHRFRERIEWSMFHNGRPVERSVEYFLAHTVEDKTKGDWEVREVRWVKAEEALQILRHRDLRRLLQRALYYVED